LEDCLLEENQISRLFKRKKFFSTLFSEAIGSGNNLTDNQYIRVFQKKDDFNKVTFWNNIDDLNNYVDNNRFSSNTYFTLATTDGKAGAEENLQYRYFLAWDFDKKLDNKLTAKEIMFKFKKYNLWYHSIIDSGNGYHVYMCINKTNDFRKVEEVTKILGLLFGADPEGMLQTQILRVPFTNNLKYKSKQVNIVNIFDKNSIKPYDINKLYNKFCRFCTTISDNTIQYATSKTKFPPCILKILNGVDEGDRNFCLKRLISFLKIHQYSQSESWNIVKEWNNKNEPPINDKELEYQFEYVYDKEYKCFGCVTEDARMQNQIQKYCDKETCVNNYKNEILYIEGDSVQLEYKLCKKLEPQRKDILQLKGNHLLIICVLKNNPEGLKTDEIIDKLTYKGKCSLSNKTLYGILNELSDNGYITKIQGNKRAGQKDFYKMNPIKCEEIEKFNLSYFAVLGVIKENITPEDFKVYCYLRYRNHKKLSLVQEHIAEELGLEQSTISIHINNLLREKYLELKGIDYSVNPFGVNFYKINY
jgi:DNA-binding MarR family transcriptional regulator